VPVKDQRSQREGRGLHPDPQQGEVVAQGDQRGRRKEAQQAADQRPPAPRTLGAQVAYRIDRDRGEQDRHHREDDQTEGVDRQPVVEDRSRGCHPERSD
jgi:hypothetical protein